MHPDLFNERSLCRGAFSLMTALLCVGFLFGSAKANAMAYDIRNMDQCWAANPRWHDICAPSGFFCVKSRTQMTDLEYNWATNRSYARGDTWVTGIYEWYCHPPSSEWYCAASCYGRCDFEDISYLPAFTSPVCDTAVPAYIETQGWSPNSRNGVYQEASPYTIVGIQKGEEDTIICPDDVRKSGCATLNGEKYMFIQDGQECESDDQCYHLNDLPDRPYPSKCLPTPSTFDDPAKKICQVSTVSCGNGVSEGEEECDDGNTVSGDGCTAQCIVEFCGDGIKNDGGNEECDDGNEDNQDGCTDACVREYCGDGTVQDYLDEQCDDGDDNSDTQPNACRTDCRNDWCGDGIIDSDEECDPGIAGTVCNDLCDICQSNNECQGGLCGFCDTPCTRVACSCGPDGDCVRESVPDSSCTGGECNPWPQQCGDLQPHGLDCGGLPENSCQWCVLDYWGPRGEGYWQCDPYPNAEILWPNQCGGGDDGSSTPPSSSSSSSRRSSIDNGVIDFPDGGNDNGDSDDDGSGSEGNNGGGSAGSEGAPCTHYGTGSSLPCFSSASFSEGDDSTDDGGFSSEAADDTGSSSSFSSMKEGNSSFNDNDGTESSAQSSVDSSSSDTFEDDQGDTTAASSEGDDFQSESSKSSSSSRKIFDTDSSSSSYEQCDFCPACVSCRRCGLGLMNVCDANECGALGLCVFESGLLGGSCTADPQICGVCE